MLMTKFFFLLLLTISTKALDKDNEESNDVSPSSQSNIKLDSTLRKALLRALAELENSGSEKETREDDDDSVHRAQASTFTIYAKSTIEEPKIPQEKSEIENNVTTENSSNEESTTKIENTTAEIELETTVDPKTPAFVLFQRSNSILDPISIKSIEKDPQIDPLKDAELFLTSASNNFNRDVNSKSENTKVAPNKEVLDGKGARNFKINHQNAIVDEDARQKLQKNQESTPETSTTTLAPTSTTHESEAKVEQVQFFSAPLVAAFTVHQDEQGQPKKVEPIFKNQSNNKEEESTVNSQEKDVKSNIQNQQQLEEQLIRLRQQQAQQELYFQQQLLQQQQSRNTNGQQQFATLINKAKNPSGKLEPVFAEPDKSVLNQALASTVLNGFNSNDVKNIGVSQTTQRSTISVQSSISFDPSLAELGKLPLNARFLPIKEANNFHTPFVNSLNFQPLPSVQQNNVFQPNSQINFNKQTFPHLQTGFKPLNQESVSLNFAQPQLTANNFNQAPNFNNGFIQTQIPFQQTNFNNFRQQNLLNNNDFNPGRFNIGQLPLNNGQTRFNRQEIGTGNFLNNNNGFSIQQSNQPFSSTHEISFVRSTNNPLLENNRFFRSNAENNFITPQNTRFFNSQNNNNRIFRSNQEGAITNLAPPQVNRQLNSLLFNQGFGGRNAEDLNVVTKVLSLNYDQNNRVLRNVPPFK